MKGEDLENFIDEQKASSMRDIEENHKHGSPISRRFSYENRLIKLIDEARANEKKRKNKPSRP